MEPYLFLKSCRCLARFFLIHRQMRQVDECNFNEAAGKLFANILASVNLEKIIK